jgi:hypothetical protein
LLRGLCVLHTARNLTKRGHILLSFGTVIIELYYDFEGNVRAIQAENCGIRGLLVM